MFILAFVLAGSCAHAFCLIDMQIKEAHKRIEKIQKKAIKVMVTFSSNPPASKSDPLSTNPFESPQDAPAPPEASSKKLPALTILESYFNHLNYYARVEKLPEIIAEIRSFKDLIQRPDALESSKILTKIVRSYLRNWKSFMESDFKQILAENSFAKAEEIRLSLAPGARVPLEYFHLIDKAAEAGCEQALRIIKNYRLEILYKSLEDFQNCRPALDNPQAIYDIFTKWKTQYFITDLTEYLESLHDTILTKDSVTLETIVSSQPPLISLQFCLDGDNEKIFEEHDAQDINLCSAPGQDTVLENADIKA